MKRKQGRSRATSPVEIILRVALDKSTARINRGTHLIIFVPGNILSSQDKPVFLRSSFHDANIIDGQPTLSDHLDKGKQMGC